MNELDKLKKAPRISSKVKDAIKFMVEGDAKTVTAAAEKAGISREHLSRELSKPHITEHLRQKVLRNLVVASARAGDTKVKLLESNNAMVADRASSFILGLIGISPEAAPAAPTNGIVPGLQIVIVTDPRRHVADADTPMIDITPAQKLPVASR